MEKHEPEPASPRRQVRTDPVQPDRAQLADWLEGRLAAEGADRVAAAVALGDAGLQAPRRLAARVPEAVPRPCRCTPPPLVRQRLRQHFGRWSRSQGNPGASRCPWLKAVLMFDSRMDRPLIGGPRRHRRRRGAPGLPQRGGRPGARRASAARRPGADGGPGAADLLTRWRRGLRGDRDRAGHGGADDRRRRARPVRAESGAAHGRRLQVGNGDLVLLADWICVAVRVSLRTELGVGDLLVGGSDAERLAHLRSEGLADASGLHWVMGRAQELVHDDPQAPRPSAGCATGPPMSWSCRVSAKVRYLQAQIVTDRGDLEDGLRLIGLARERWRRAGQPTAALRTELGRMQILDDLGRHSEALAVGQPAQSPRWRPGAGWTTPWPGPCAPTRSTTWAPRTGCSASTSERCWRTRRPSRSIASSG